LGEAFECKQTLPFFRCSWRLPHGKRGGVAICRAGNDPNPDRAEADVRSLRLFDSPVADTIQRMPYPIVNTGVDWLFPPGGLNHWKLALFSNLSEPGAPSVGSVPLEEGDHR
jgi:hypothetical protein